MSRSASSAAGALHAELDGAVLSCAAVLAAFGVVMSLSATAPLSMADALPPHFLRHCGTLLVGAALALAVARVPAAAWRAAAFPLWAVALALLLATALAGVEVNGARRWLAVPGMGTRFQPVELVKLVTLLAVVRLVARPARRGDLLEGRRVLLAGLLVVPPATLLVLQPDLGNAALLCLLAALVLCVGGARWRHLAAGGALALAAGGAFVLRNPYALRRVTGFLHPWETSGDEGFQLVQSFAAFGHGGLLGVGLGDGRQKLFYLPEAHTDFILALVAEELGVVGVWLVLGAFGALWLAGLRVARRARDRFDMLLAFATTSLLAVPAAVNAGVVMGVLPTKGLTLPFLSYGRTSLLCCCAAVGLLLGVARRSAAPRRQR